MSAWRYAPEPLPRFVGWAALGVLAAFVLAGAVSRPDDRPALTLVAGLVAVAAAAVSTLAPRRALLGGAVVAAAALVVLGNDDPSLISWFGLCILAAWCTMSLPLAVATAFGAGEVLVVLGELLFVDHDPGWVAWMGGTCFSVIGAYAGIAQRRLLTDLREAQAGLAQRAQADERSRIARELHDVIAHSLTVSLLHVTSARLAVADAPDEAEAALAEAERLGRRSLDEVRQVVGLLRHAEMSEASAPLPGGKDIRELIDGFRRAGADIDADITDGVSDLRDTVGLAVYRIVQESLTNAGKHAPGTRVTVRLRVERAAVHIEVDSGGPPGRGAGLGLLGMRERAASLGGCCEAAPGGSGWLVRAELPLVSVEPSA